MDRKKHYRPTNGDDDIRRHIEKLTSSTYKRRQTHRTRKNPLLYLVIPASLALGIGAEGIFSTTRHYEEHLLQQTICTPQIISNTPFIDRVVDSEPDTLNLPLPARNLAHLVSAWKIAFTTAESINGQSEHPLPQTYLNALMTWEMALELKAEEGWFYERGRERPISSSTGHRGLLAIGKATLADYNQQNKEAPYKWDDMWSYEASIRVGLEKLQKDRKYRQGNLFFTDLDYVSGRGTTDHLEKQYDTIDEMVLNLWKNNSSGRAHSNPKKKITRAMVKQATVHVYQVAALTYLYDQLERAYGLNPERRLTDDDKQAYREFLAICEWTYKSAQEEAQTTKPTTFARFYNDRLIRKRLFNGELLAMRLESLPPTQQ